MTISATPSLVIFIVMSAVLMSCTPTTYVAYDSAEEGIPFAGRRVAFFVSDSFWRDPPECAVIMPAADAPSANIANMVERALFRYLSGRIPRVVGPRQRRQLTRKLAVDLEDSGDRRVFMGETRCRGFLNSRITMLADDFVVVWARKSIGLDLSLGGPSKDSIMWRARHTANRSDGGLPLSPLSASLGAIEATRFHTDADILPSLVDDVVRRTIATLPDVR